MGNPSCGRGDVMTGTYHTTLTECDCPDYAYRRQYEAAPCKHMMALADSFGLVRSDMAEQTQALATQDRREQLIEYTDHHSQAVKLNINIVQKQFSQPDNPLSVEQAYLFMQFCKSAQLNPFLNECYVWVDRHKKLTIHPAWKAWLQRADRHPDFEGVDMGIIIQAGQSIVERETDMIYAGETVIGGWATVYRRGRRPTRVKIAKREIERDTPTWKASPAHMCMVRAASRGLQIAFPQEYHGWTLSDDDPSGESSATVLTPGGQLVDSNTGEVVDALPEGVVEGEAKETTGVEWDEPNVVTIPPAEEHPGANEETGEEEEAERQDIEGSEEPAEAPPCTHPNFSVHADNIARCPDCGYEAAPPAQPATQPETSTCSKCKRPYAGKLSDHLAEECTETESQRAIKRERDEWLKESGLTLEEANEVAQAYFGNTTIGLYQLTVDEWEQFVEVVADGQAQAEEAENPDAEGNAEDGVSFEDITQPASQGNEQPAKPTTATGDFAKMTAEHYLNMLGNMEDIDRRQYNAMVDSMNLGGKRLKEIFDGKTAQQWMEVNEGGHKAALTHVCNAVLAS